MTEKADQDLSDSLCSRVAEAYASGEPLYIEGGNSKRHWLGRHCDAKALDVSQHRGIVDYQPGELVVTARSGTTVAELQAVLAEKHQTVAADPPHLNGRATLGGSVACNLSGPGRPWAGSVRDALLGVRLINGRGELLRFGGTVLKNVAGYDASRLQAGALGCLSVLSEISLRLMPLPEAEVTLRYEISAMEAMQRMNDHAGKASPLSGACWFQGQLYLRLTGSTSAVRQTANTWGGEHVSEGVAFWQSLREFSLPFFQHERALYRLSVSPTHPPEPSHLAQLIDWGGAQRWVQNSTDEALDEMTLYASTTDAGGHACRFWQGKNTATPSSNDHHPVEVRSPLEPAQQHIQQRLKHAFDPKSILNPGRLYSWL